MTDHPAPALGDAASGVRRFGSDAPDFFETAPHPITLAEQAARTGRTPEMMAACIRGRIECLGTCDRQDLLRDGFPARDVAWYWPESLQIALETLGEMPRAAVAALPAAAALVAFTAGAFCLGVALGMGGSV